MLTSPKKAHLRQIEKSATDVAQAWADAEAYHKRLLVQIEKTLADEEAAVTKQQGEIEAELKQSLAQVHKESNVAKAQINEEQNQRQNDIRNKAMQELLAIDSTFHQRLQDQQDESAKAKTSIKAQYDETMANVQAMLGDVEARLGSLCRPWSEILASEYVCPEAMADAVRFGTVAVKGEADSLEVPALLPFIGGKNIIIKVAGAEAKAKAVQALQNMILRLLFFSPPSKLRLLLIDPAGLGDNLAFLLPHGDVLEGTDNQHGNPVSADQFKQQMVGGKVWVESADIDKRLAEMSAHLQNVVQKYLRGAKFKNMEEYNRQAGEVEEPFKLMAVVNFPVNFNDQTARQLASIAANGPRCGVHTLITWDMDQKPLHGFNPGDLESNATILRWEDDHFVWEDQDFKQAALTMEGPPTPAEIEQLTQAIWQQARLASRRVLPFAKIVPQPDILWGKEGTTRSGLKVPIGQSGAEGRLYFELGQGTSVHALLTGQTGTGKSNLLHIIICSLATAYSPDELELYLVDFKKGVEFKAYAPTADGLGALPHARAIAIESEREFGLSCLQALCVEMDRRGELFRGVGCQKIEEYRNKTNETLPRILLLVDEFQVFFEEEDRVCEQAKQCLDKLVSQSRSTGIHIILATQTLERSKTLPSGIMSQMAIRIALKASTEQDSMKMIGNRDAFSLLERMGEAFYNSANGLPQSNTRFQVPYLAEEERDNLLRDFKRNHPNDKDVVIFEGSQPARVEDTPYWRHLIALPTWPGKTPVLRAPLGLPVAIKPPTAARFFHQPGRNLLVVGRDEQAGVGILTAIACGLASQRPASDLRFLFWNLNSVESPYFDWPEHTAQALSSHQVEIGKIREIPEMIQEVAVIVDQRLADRSAGNPEIFIIGFGLQRSRDLIPERTGGFPPVGADAAKSAGPGTLFAKILRVGPAVGVYVVGWWDSFVSLSKAVDRPLLREFGMRVVLNMSKEDSLNLVGETDAAKLAPHRALFWEEEEVGKLEKFIPFAPPTQKWLTGLGESLGRRVE